MKVKAHALISQGNLNDLFSIGVGILHNNGDSTTKGLIEKVLGGTWEATAVTIGTVSMYLWRRTA